MEGLLRQFDAYCERADFTFWSEPVNALTNMAFLIAALVMWRWVRRQRMPLAGAMCGADIYFVAFRREDWLEQSGLLPILLHLDFSSWREWLQGLAVVRDLCTFSPPHDSSAAVIDTRRSMVSRFS